MRELKCPDCGHLNPDIRELGYTLPATCGNCPHIWRLQDDLEVIERLKQRFRDDPERTMDKRELALLERAYAAEVNAALSKVPRVLQTKSKLADKLVADGLLRKAEEIYRGSVFAVRLEGYELTEAGRMAYCLTC